MSLLQDRWLLRGRQSGRAYCRLNPLGAASGRPMWEAWPISEPRRMLVLTELFLCSLGSPGKNRSDFLRKPGVRCRNATLSKGLNQ